MHRHTARRVLAASVTLAIAQLIHGATPAETEAEGSVGLVGGAALLLASIAAAAGAARRKDWSAPLGMWTGGIVALGFVLYHAVPVTSPLTNPYWGEPVGVAAWLSVAISVAAGAWAAVEGWRAAEAVRPALGT